jgi:hypothetical protein
MLFAGCTQQEVVNECAAVKRKDSTDYTPRTGCPRVTIPRQDPQIRLPHLLSYFRTAVKTAATIAGRGNQCVSAQTVRNRL